MGGRADYEERKQRRIERYKAVSQKAKEESEARYNSTANRILMMTPAQPIIVGHHSEKKARRLHEQANNDIKKSIELSEKSQYYEEKARNVENSNVIYNDDPDAIPKLKGKLERLQNQRESIKSREHETWELTKFFKHKNYTNYLAYSEYAIRNRSTAHGLFGKINGFSDIQEMEDIEPINRHIIQLADNKVPIYRVTISLDEYDAIKLGYDSQDKWKELFESKLVSFAEKMNIKYEDLQYTGAVHLESGHPHLQVMLWSKQKDKMNYYIDYGRINKMRDEFTNAIFREDLIELYKEKDIAKKGIIEKNQLLQKLKKVSSDSKFIKEIIQYEKDFATKKIMRKTFKDKELKQIVDDLLLLKQELKNTKGSIKYQYLKKYPNVIKQVDSISRKIIDLSIECKIELENYILAKQKIVSFKYQDKQKIEEAKQVEREKANEEILKLIGNQILNFERVLLNEKEEYSQIRYINQSRNLIWRVFDCIYFSSRQQEKYIRRFELKYKKQLSKQAKKDLAIKKANSSSFNWEDEI